MKRKVSWLIVATLTFIVGVVSVTSWYYFRNPRSSSQPQFTMYVERELLRGSDRMHVCLKRFDINLGDSFDYVNGHIHLTPDPNGPNENIAWQKGKHADFLSLSEPLIEIDKNNKLFAAIYCTFDDQQRLRSFQMSWTLNGEQNNFIKRKIIDILLARELTCINGKEIDLKKNTYKVKLDSGDYTQEFEYDFSGGSALWGVGYSMTLK